VDAAVGATRTLNAYHEDAIFLILTGLKKMRQA
jgi:hypothetical protein